MGKLYKTINHTKTIPRRLPTNCLSVFDHFVGLALKGLKFINWIKPKLQMIRPWFFNYSKIPLTWSRIYSFNQVEMLKKIFLYQLCEVLKETLLKIFFEN